AWIRGAAARASLVTSVCTGALLLAQSGLLRGRRATTHWAALDLLASLDPTIDVQRGVRVASDTIVTPAGVSAGMGMAFAVAARRLRRRRAPAPPNASPDDAAARRRLRDPAPSARGVDPVVVLKVEPEGDQTCCAI